MSNEFSRTCGASGVRPMKITFILPFASLTGGIRVASLYATRLAARGHDVRVVSQPHGGPGLKERLRAALRGQRLHKPAGASFLDALGPRHTILDTPRPVVASDVQGADFVIATWWETAEWVARLPASKGRKLYLLQDYEMFPHLPLERVAATYHAGLRMIAVSSYIRTTVSQNHGVADIELLLNGVDGRHFNALPRGRNPSLTVGFLYQKGERKNLPLTLAAIARAKERIPGLKVRAFGSNAPPQDDPLPGYVSLEIAPPQARIPEIYAGCDAWLVPSKREGFGLPLLEAMACRTPVLATRFGASEDIIEDGRNGWLLPPEADAFAETLVQMDRMPPAAWTQMSETARRTAEAWDWDGRVDQFEANLQAWRSE